VYEEHFFTPFLLEKKGLVVNTGYTEEGTSGEIEKR
jgi:hypothetical protein